jgi:hypothetical protein
MRKARRQKILGRILSLEKALKNIGLSGVKIKVEEVDVGINDFLHVLHHTVKTLRKEGHMDGLVECGLCGKMVSSSIVYNDVRVCRLCVRLRKIWQIIPEEDLREAGWIV